MPRCFVITQLGGASTYEDWRFFLQSTPPSFIETTVKTVKRKITVQMHAFTAGVSWIFFIVRRIVALVD